MTKRARRAAALKGWETRRANAAARSRAAKRGWKTRRANEKKQKAKKRAQGLHPRRKRHTRDRVRRRTSEQGGADFGGDDFGGSSSVHQTDRESESSEAYDDLDDFIDGYESWDFDYDYYDVEGTAEYGDET